MIYQHQRKNVIKYQTANISANFVDRLSWEIGNEALKNINILSILKMNTHIQTMLLWQIDFMNV